MAAFEEETMSRSRRAGRIAGTVVAGLVLTGILVPTAQASLGQCGSGEACIWTDLSYTGSVIHRSDYMKRLGLLFNDLGTSVASNGNRSCARFWEHADFTGAYVSFSRPARGGIYRDPDLRNGGGYGPYNRQDWNDRITSQSWTTCPI